MKKLLLATMCMGACGGVPDEIMFKANGDSPTEKKGASIAEIRKDVTQTPENTYKDAVRAATGKDVPATESRYLDYNATWYYDGGWFGGSWDQVVGSRYCFANRERDEAFAWKSSGGGWCTIRSWVNEGDPFDCRANLHIGVPAWQSGTCEVQIYTK